MVKERIQAYYAAKHKYPQNVIYYRDGVSIGQRAKVKHDELSQIRAAYKEVVKTDLTSLTAIICVKRHHTRFYPVSATDETESGNCKPGTMVDSGITSPYFCDFFLQSHHGLKGTAIPTHYFVVENGMEIPDGKGGSRKLSEGDLQKFVSWFCL